MSNSQNTEQTEQTGQDDAYPDSGAEIEFTDLDQRGDDKQRGFSRRVNDFFEHEFSAKRPRRRVSLAVAALLVACALFIVVSGYAGSFFRLLASDLHAGSGTPSTQASVPRSYPAPESLGSSGPFTCIMDASWSPDGRSIAVLGYTNGCPASPSEKGLVEIYDAHTGKLITRILPEAPIFQALHSHFASYTTLFYDSILWSPDGMRLAILFAAVAAKGPQLDGLLLLDRDGRHAEVLLHVEAISSTPSYEYLVWDIVQRRPVHIAYVPALPGDYVINIPVALSYRWEADGVLVPQMVTNGATLTGPVGNPDGGSSFTPWQPGFAALTFQNGNAPSYLPGVYTWTTYFTAWSPDGRYIANGLYIAGRLTSPALPLVSRRILVALQADRLPTLPVRDKGLEQALGLLKVPAGPAPGSVTFTAAWRPDGREIAINDSSDISIYDCTSGRLLATFSIPASPTTQVGGGVIMRWSPDGSSLLLAGPGAGVGIIWRPG